MDSIREKKAYNVTVFKVVVVHFDAPLPIPLTISPGDMNLGSLLFPSPSPFFLPQLNSIQKYLLNWQAQIFNHSNLNLIHRAVV